MGDDIATGLSAIGLVFGFPLLLLAGIWLLAWLESWMLQPDERAEEVERLLDREEPESIELAVTMMMADVADTPEQRVKGRRWPRRIDLGSPSRRP